MADPLSIGASALAVATAAFQSTRSLCAAVKRYKDRDKTLNRLHHELEDLSAIISSLKEAIDAEAGSSTLELLKGPVSRCSQLCHEFEDALNKFGHGTKTGLRDWAKMEFMAGNINDFIDTIMGYKSTIAVGLGTVTMHLSKVNRQALEDYEEMIKDTAYNLEIHLQRIDEKLIHVTTHSTTDFIETTDLKDEREVTKQCLRVCNDARAYIEALQSDQQSLLQGPMAGTPDTVKARFEAQVIANATLQESQEKFAKTMDHIQERLNFITSSDTPRRDEEILRLKEDINISKQCLEVCKNASAQVSHQKIHIIGEVIADDDTDQVVVTTLADLFDVRKVLAKSRSAQLVGSMNDESLQKLSKDRYSSRFGTMPGDSAHLRMSTTAQSPPTDGNWENKSSTWRSQHTGKGGQPGSSERNREKPSSNEVRRRTGEGENNPRRNMD